MGGVANKIVVDEVELWNTTDSIFVNLMPMDEHGEIDDRDEYAWTVEVKGDGKILVYFDEDQVVELDIDELRNRVALGV